MDQMGNSNLLRTLNTHAVRQALKAEGLATKARLAQLTGLSTVTVNTALEQLTQAGEAALDALVPSNGGRPARRYRFCADHRAVLALYIRERRLHIQVADLYGTCLHQEEEGLGRADGARFRPVVERLLERFPAIGALSFGIPGVVRAGLVMAGDHPGLAGVNLEEEYRCRYGLPVAVENDVNLAVLGYVQARPDYRSVAYLYFPEQDAPGAGVVLHGALCPGAHCLAGEIGPLPPGVDWQGLNRGDVRAVCRGIADVVRSYACILDPERIVLYGAFLSGTHLETIAGFCREGLALGLQPELVLAENFEGDYGRGTVARALALLS